MTYPKNPSKIGAAGITLIKQFEGCRLKAYRDIVGKWTIGYGSTTGVSEGDEITAEEAEERLQRDLAWFENGVAKVVEVKIRQNQFDALVSLTYNIGLGNFRKSTVLRKLNNRDDFGAAAAFLMWRKAGGVEVVGLLRRRRAERELFLRGTEPVSGGPSLSPIAG